MRRTVTRALGYVAVAALLVSAPTVEFGNYEPLVTNRTQPLNATGGVNLRSTMGTAVTVNF